MYLSAHSGAGHCTDLVYFSATASWVCEVISWEASMLDTLVTGGVLVNFSA